MDKVFKALADPTRRALLARLVIDHRLSAHDPLEPATGEWEGAATELVFSDRKISLPDVAGLLVA